MLRVSLEYHLLIEDIGCATYMSVLSQAKQGEASAYCVKKIVLACAWNGVPSID